MAGAAWLTLLLPLAGCLQAAIDPADDVEGALQGEPPPPVLVVQADEQEDQAIFTAVSAGLEWNTLGVSGHPAGTMAIAGRTDGESAGVAVVSGQPSQPSSSPEQALAGDYLSFCASGEAVGPVKYFIVETTSNTILADLTLESVAPCP
jgi:hypothetical protein